MGNEIPTKSRQLVRARDGDQCARCGAGNHLAWHHRRRRAVKGHFQHCPCIGIQLCHTCHSFVHAYPATAALTGFIIGAHVEEPWLVPLRTFDGWVLNDCDGDSAWADPPIPETP